MPSLGDEPTHASLSHDQRYLFVANYAVAADPGGSLVVVPVAKDGKLKPVVQQARHTPSKVNPERQAGAHVHSLVLSPDGRHLYASDLGADKVFIYRYDGASPEHPLSPAIPPSGRPAAGRQPAPPVVRRQGPARLSDPGDECRGGGVRCARRCLERAPALAADRE